HAGPEDDRTPTRAHQLDGCLPRCAIRHFEAFGFESASQWSTCRVIRVDDDDSVHWLLTAVWICAPRIPPGCDGRSASHRSIRLTLRAMFVPRASKCPDACDGVTISLESAP